MAGTLTTVGEVAVGRGGGGILSIPSSGTVNSAFGLIGDQASGNGQVTLDGSASWNMTGYLGVGDDGTGTLNLAGFGVGETPTLTTGFASIGEIVLSHGTATLSNNSLWNNGGALEVGGDGYGQLTIASGSAVNSGWIDVAQRGIGILSIETGGTATTGPVKFGVEAGSNATVTVHGNNSKLIAGTIVDPWYIDVGHSGNGTLTVHSGGLVSTPGDFSLAVNSGSQGTVNINNGGTVTVGRTAVVGGWWQQAGGAAR